MEGYKSQLASQVVQGGKDGESGYFREEKEGEGIYEELSKRMDKLSE